MFRTDVIAGSADVSVPLMVIDSTTGVPETAWDFEETGIDLWYRRAGGAEVSITEATQTANGAHSDGGVVHISDGRGRLDLPDAAVAVGVPYVEYGGTITGMIVMGGVVQLTDPVNGLFESQVIGDTGNDTTHVHVATWTYGDDEINNYLLAVYDVSEAEWHWRWVTDWVNSTKLATLHAALPFTPANDTDLVCLLGATKATLALEATLGSPSDTDLATDIANLDTKIDTVDSEVGTIDTVVDAVKVVTDALTSAAATKLAASAAGIITGAAATGTLNTTTATTNLTGFADDQLIGRVLVVTSGDAAGEATDITDYAETGGTLTFTALTTAMANGDTFCIV